MCWRVNGWVSDRVTTRYFCGQQELMKMKNSFWRKDKVCFPSGDMFPVALFSWSMHQCLIHQHTRCNSSRNMTAKRSLARGTVVQCYWVHDWCCLIGQCDQKNNSSSLNMGHLCQVSNFVIICWERVLLV